MQDVPVNEHGRNYCIELAIPNIFSNKTIEINIEADVGK